MSRAGKPTDNPVNEALNGWIKEELFIDFRLEECRTRYAVKDVLIELSYRILEKNFPCEVLEINTDVDHIHIMFDAPPQVQLSALVNSYKTVTARLLRKEFQEQLSKFYWKPVFWSQSYFIGTVSDRSRETVAQYIRDQGNKEKG